MEMKNEEISSKIVNILQQRFPHIGSGHTKFINDMVEYLDMINQKPKILFMALKYPENISQETLNNTRDRIQSELIDGDIDYRWRIDKPRNDYKKGLYCAMRFIDMLVNQMNPD